MLAVLLRTPGTPVPTDALLDRVWGDRHVGTAARYKYIGWLRSALAPYGAAVVHGDHGYVLRVDPNRVDLHQFREYVTQAQEAVRAVRLPDATRLLRQGLRLWRGPALSGIPGAWAQMFRDQLASERRAAATLRFQVEMTLGRHAEALPGLAEWEAEAPTDETIIGLHMLALYRSGQPALALACYQQAEARIRQSFSAAPGSALELLSRRIRGRDASLATSPVLAGYHGPTPAVAERASPAPRAAPGAAGKAAHRDEPAAQRVAAPDRYGSVPRQLPAAVRQFTGRTDELKTLTGLVCQPDEPGAVIAAIGGTAGVGKTVLAVYWSHQVAERFPDGQLYVNLRGFDPSGMPVAPGEAICGFLDALGVEPANVPSGLDAQAALYRSLLAGRRVLVVLDNARDASQVRPLLPGSAGCLTVVTSRTAVTSLVAAEGAVPLTLDLLSPAEAYDLLSRRLGAERVAAEPVAVDDLIRLCARLPLALSIAAARAAIQSRLPLAALVTQLSDGRGRLDALDSGDASNNVRAVFSWSYQQLTESSARMFRLLSLAPGADISAPAAASLAEVPVSEAGAALDELAHAQLLTEHAPRRFALHDLLRAYAQERSWVEESDTEREAAAHRLLDHYLHAAHGAALLINTARPPLRLTPPRTGVLVEHNASRATGWAWFEAERLVLLAAVGYAAERGYHAHAWQLAWCLADYYHQRGHWHDWAATQEAGLAAAERLGDLVGQARCHQYLGYALGRLGAHAQGHAHLRDALSLFEQLDDRAAQGSVHMMRAITFERQKYYRDALTHARRAVQLLRAAGRWAALANALNGVGWYHALLGEHQEAITYCQQALDTHRELGNSHGEASTLDSLGYAYRHLGSHQEAIDCYRGAVELHQRLGDRYRLAGNLVGLGDTYHATGSDELALDAWRQALTIFEELGHSDAEGVRGRVGRVDAARWVAAKPQAASKAR
jgi:tetratricopeptide (TPR) repeat protein/DNA-binding SARP family transcriptional activator